MTIIDHAYVIGLCLTMAYAVIKIQPQLKGKVYSTADKQEMYTSQSVFLYAIATAAVAIWIFGGREISRLGFQWPGEQKFLYGALTSVFLAWYLLDLSRVFLFPGQLEKAKQNWKQNTPFMPSNSIEMRPAMHMAVCAGICEEIVFRGFLFCYFTSLFHGDVSAEQSFALDSWLTILAIIIPAMIFSLSHLYHGWKTMFKLAGLSLIFGFIFVASESLLIVAVLHVFVDVSAMMISPTMLADSEPES